MASRAYKYRFYPTPEQAQLLAQTFGCMRFAYNHVLRWRTDAFFQRQEKIGYLEWRPMRNSLDSSALESFRG